MNKKLILCALLILFSSANAVTGKVRKKARKMPKIEERYEEIDNFDFLYTNGGEFADINTITADNIIDEAFLHIGARYRSGSKGPNAFDCSGFTSYVFSQTGIQIGCSSRDQYARNIPISRKEMQRGDLVFFTSPGSGHGVGHVGIVVDVDPITQSFSFIHASSKEGVKVSQSYEGFYAKRYVGVRRVLQ